MLLLGAVLLIMEYLFMVKYQISDRGIDYPVKEEEVVVLKGSTVAHSLKKLLNKYRHAMDLSNKFTFKIISHYHSGWSN